MTMLPFRSCWRWSVSPLERAAFLLHDVFGLDFDEIAKTIQRDAAACRQLAARARKHVREERPVFRSTSSAGSNWRRPFTASRSGDMNALGAMLAADVNLQADGGGKRPAFPKPVFGFDEVMKTHEKLAGYFRGNQSTLLRTVFINGLPGIITREADGEIQTTALDIEDGKIVGIYVVRNPDKLKHLH